MALLRYIGSGSIDLTSIHLGTVTSNGVVDIPRSLQAQFEVLAGPLAFWVDPSPSSGIPNPETNEFTTVFTSDGTWTKPANARLIRVVAIGAGGGGGSGGKSLTGNIAPGGGGGAGGAYLNALFPAEVIPSSVVITVGEGGVGGVSQTTVGADGNDGDPGEDTTFGVFLTASGGDGGGGGLSKTEGTGGAGNDGSLISYFTSPATGSAGADGGNSLASPTLGGNGFDNASPVGGAAGGGAGGFVEAGLTTHAGTDGGANVLLDIDGGGHYPGSTAVIPPNFDSTTWIPGVGGGGGDGSITGPKYAGRDGFQWGGGGGGGSPGWSDGGSTHFDSGAGGAGANGLCAIQVFF